MQALKLPARRGWRWLLEGFMIFRKKPTLLSFLVVGYWVVMLLINAVPWIGQVIATVLIPVFSVSLMNACRLVSQGAPLPPQLLFSGFDRNPRALVVLGIIYLLCSLGIVAATALIDGGMLLKLLLFGTRPEQQVLIDSHILLAIQVALALFVPVMLAYWYAPVLVAWHDLPPGKALFFSLVAGLRNWRVFIVYAIAVLLFGAFLPGVVLAVIERLLAQAGDLFASVLTFFAILILLPTLYASFYVSYRDVFVIIDEDA